MNNPLQETELIISEIAASCAELALAQGERVGGRFAWHYIGIDEAREIIKTEIARALRRYEHFIMSN